jgi:hypothetical protein
MAALLLLLPSLLWAATDRHAWPWDPAWYGEVTADLWSALLLDSPGAWGWQMLHAIGSKPPAVVWLGQLLAPLSGLVGWEAALLLSILATQGAALLLLQAGLARLFGRGSAARWAGLLAMAASPLFVGMTHQYFAEPIQLLSVCLFLWIAASRHAMGRLRLVLWLLLAASLGMAAKVTTPLYAFGFGLVALTALAGPRDEIPLERRAGTILLALAALALAGLTAAWYAVNAGFVLQHAVEASTGGDALHYGSPGSLAAKLAFWLGSLKSAATLPWALPALALALAAGLLPVTRWQAHAAAAVPGGAAVIAAAGLQLLAVLVVLSLSVNEETRFLTPVFPSIAVLAAAIAATGRPVAAGAVVGILALQ